MSRSSTETKYRALADIASELLWLRWLFKDMRVSQSFATPLHCNNRSAKQIAHNDVFYGHTKYIENDGHFIRHQILQGSIRLIFVSSTDQTTDIFTKAHSPGCFHNLVSKL